MGPLFFDLPTIGKFGVGQLSNGFLKLSQLVGFFTTDTFYVFN